MRLKYATLWPKIVLIEPKMFKPLSTKYVDPSAYSWPSNENPQRNLKGVYHLTLREYKMLGYIRT